MKITRLKKRSISVFVIIALLLSCFPLSIFASDDIPDIEVPLEPEIKITELVDRREESIKHFKMPDGTYNAISYAGAVHRMNPDGEWIDINNDLSLKTVGSKQLYTTNDSRITFAKAYSSNEDIMTLRENGYAISMALLSNQNDDDDMSMDMNANASLVTVNNSNHIRPESFDTIDEAIEINNKSSISYSNVLADTDIEYVMNGNDIKENIIVKDRADSYVYAFSLSLDGLIPVLDESGAIYLNDEESGDTKYVIPAPYMYDSNDEYSEDVYYELFHVGGDKYLLTVTASSEWINDEERAFPVTVDPSIVYSTGTPIDTYISSTKPMSQHGSSVALWADNTNTTLINIPLPSIHTSTNAGIFISADLVINYYGTKAYGTATVEVYRILESWSENTVTYNTRPDMEETRSSYALVAVPEGYNYNNSRVAMLNITNSIKNYYDTGKPFYGIALKIPESENANSQITMRIKSHESGVAYEEYMIVSYNTLDIGEKIYRISVPETNLTVQIDDSDSTNDYRTVGAEIEAKSSENFDSFQPQAWHFVYAYDGLYRILSVNSDMAIAVNSMYLNSSNAALRQEEYASVLTQLWRVTIASSGNYVFRAASAGSSSTDWCMARGNSTIGTEKVCQRAYSNDSSYTDEWNLNYMGLASGRVRMEAQQTDSWCWATAARMFAMNYDDIPSNRDQRSAVAQVYNEITDEETLNHQGGNNSAAQEAINYYLGNYLDAETTLDTGHGIYSEATLISLLNLGDVIYISTSTYKTSIVGNQESGHSMLIYGYYNDGVKNIFLIRDPSPYVGNELDLLPGRTIKRSYADLCSRDYTSHIEEDNVEYEVSCHEYWYATIVMIRTENAAYRESFISPVG